MIGYLKDKIAYPAKSVGVPTINKMIKCLQKLKEEKINVEKNIKNLKENKKSKKIPLVE